MKCESCEGSFESLPLHWSLSSCDYPELSDYQKDILIGVLMGDGSVIVPEHRNEGYLTVSVVEDEFLDWLFDELGWLVEAKRYEEPDKDIHSLRTLSHPFITDLRSWYDTGRKRYPGGLELNSTIAKMWYVTDGGLSWNGERQCIVSISCENELRRGDFLRDLFRQVGFEVGMSHGMIRFKNGHGERFLEWIGEPVPGFEYKWKSEDRELYDSVK